MYIYITKYCMICRLGDIQPLEVRTFALLQVVSWIKRIMNCEKTGHSGTLDPKATWRT